VSPIADTRRERQAAAGDRLPLGHWAGNPPQSFDRRNDLMIRWMYVCVSTTCGHVEQVNYAPAATMRCPVGGGLMRREQA
jgi:hypothetical protein